MSIILIEKFCSLVITGLADVDRSKWCIQFAATHPPPPDNKYQIFSIFSSISHDSYS